MAQYKTPNVYVQEKSIFPPSVAEVATAIPAFIGRTEKTTYGADASLLKKPIRITSMVEYAKWFGGPYLEGFDFTSVKDEDDAIVGVKLNPTRPVAKFILYHMLAQFFANGGGACYVVSVGGYATTNADGDEVEEDPTAAAEKGLFADALAAVAKIDEVTLLVQSDAIPRMYDATDHIHYYNLGQLALSQCDENQDRFAVIDVIDTFDGMTPANTKKMSDDLSTLRGPSGVGMANLKYGATYYPNLVVSSPRSYKESKVTLDGETMSSLEGKPTHAMLKTALSRNFMQLPPAASIVGVYSRVDGNRGVWKAPANVSLSGVARPTRKITNDDQMDMNVHSSGKSVNAIRAFTDKGTLVWGARTLAGNDNEWRYVPVRRLFNMVEESVQKATAFAVFEPNVPLTWLKLRTMISSYLENLWKQGALFGATADQAFFVNVGLGQTMTEDDINNGIMNIEIGMAAVRPAEFIVLTFSHKSISA
ncbi:phage tail sheath family protein [Endozoicomonas lisbonensis]|uniref:Phage tail sheath protein FI n=1 Tax=Endozoicomonas lisbonensis TaxID=3120522 RepID=A0ABV2SCQ5_9GAMM